MQDDDDVDNDDDNDDNNDDGNDEDDVGNANNDDDDSNDDDDDDEGDNDDAKIGLRRKQAVFGIEINRLRLSDKDTEKCCRLLMEKRRPLLFIFVSASTRKLFNFWQCFLGGWQNQKLKHVACAINFLKLVVFFAVNMLRSLNMQHY